MSPAFPLPVHFPHSSHFDLKPPYHLLSLCAPYCSCALQTSLPALVTFLPGVTYLLPSRLLGWSVLEGLGLFSVHGGAEDPCCGRPSAWSWNGGCCDMLKGTLNGEAKK